jgi:transcriptional regulator of NAD metabolism
MSEPITLAEAAERIRRITEHHNSRTAQILRTHGAKIEAKAAVITPVDKGFLRRANNYHVDATVDAVMLTMENRMIYARYQHDHPHNHTQPQARDHFISLPFEAEIPAIVRDIIDADLKEATS